VAERFDRIELEPGSLAAPVWLVDVAVPEEVMVLPDVALPELPVVASKPPRVLPASPSSPELRVVSAEGVSAVLAELVGVEAPLASVAWESSGVGLAGVLLCGVEPPQCTAANARTLAYKTRFIRSMMILLQLVHGALERSASWRFSQVC
jgi:hypothetical protein